MKEKITTGVFETIKNVGSKMPLVWPLERSVAVNPYLGLSQEKFERAAIRLDRVGSIQVTMPLNYYLEKWDHNEIDEADLSEILRIEGREISSHNFIEMARSIKEEPLAKTKTLLDLVSESNAFDWNRFVVSRVSHWAASYFDKGQASWVAANKSKKPFEAWLEEAEIDRTPKIAGISNFSNILKKLPRNPILATEFVLEKLQLDSELHEEYLHSLLLKLPGWIGYAAQLDWDNNLEGKKSSFVAEMTAVLLAWEFILFSAQKKEEISLKWEESKRLTLRMKDSNSVKVSLDTRLLLHKAFERTHQNEVIRKFDKKVEPHEVAKPKAQAIFCIDVRSEVYRRKLESVDSSIETFGYAGFFGIPINYLPTGCETPEAHSPVLLAPGINITEKSASKEVEETRIKRRNRFQVWKSFKTGAATSFGFVSPMGLSFLPKIISDSLNLTRPVKDPQKAWFNPKSINQLGVDLSPGSKNGMNTGIPIDDQIQLAKNSLKGISLTDDFAPYVLVVGHGSSMVNNPHATGYQCGACGGHSGEANAKVFAEILNNVEVRSRLQKEGIYIPVETKFIACLHNTTTDEITFYQQGFHDETDPEFLEIVKATNKASQSTQEERMERFSDHKVGLADKLVKSKSTDWSQIRPEWGLTGCHSFVIAPRARTAPLDFKGRTFLHSYDWRNDENFSILESIMTAPMIVTSWINLQYYSSTVDNKFHGAGNKTLHNVTSGLGVIEGASGDLRMGLPWQALHDGEKLQHEPIKLNVFIEAPKEAINEILKNNSNVADLCNNGWINLLALNSEGKVSHRYVSDLQWEVIHSKAA